MPVAAELATAGRSSPASSSANPPRGIEPDLRRLARESDEILAAVATRQVRLALGWGGHLAITLGKASMGTLWSFWSSVKHDNATAGAREDLMNADAFSATRLEARVFDQPYQEFGVTRPAPLWLYYSGHRSDHRTVARTESIAVAVADGYVRRRLVGHVFLYEPRFAARPLRQYWSAAATDSFLLGTTESEEAALAAGYSLMSVEGWASPVVPDFLLRGNSDDDTNDGFNELGVRTLEENIPRLAASPGDRPLLTLISFGQIKAGDVLRDRPGSSPYDYAENRDIVTVTEEPLLDSSTDVEFVLRLGPDVSWWKEIALVDRSDAVVLARAVEGAGNSSLPIRVSGQASVDRFLVFVTAKLLGEDVRQYQLLDLSTKQGLRVTFNWLRDDEDPHRPSFAWQDLDAQQGDDLIRLSSGPGGPGQMTLQVTNSRKSRGWKKVAAIDVDRTELRSIVIEGERSSGVTLVVPNDALSHTRLLVSKAKVLGVHTDVFEIGDLQGMKDRTVLLEWLRDDLPDPQADVIWEWRPGFRLLEDHWGIRQFEGVHCDGDIITPIVEELAPADADMMEFVIETAGEVSWWKALRLWSIFDDFVTEVTVEGHASRSAPLRGTRADSWGADLVFAKAKVLGKHEDKYDYPLDGASLAAIGAAPGKRVVFVWSADNLPRPDGCDGS